MGCGVRNHTTVFYEKRVKLICWKGMVINMKKDKGISGSTLKIIAMIAMVIDHTGVVLVERITQMLSQGEQEVHGVASFFSLEQWIWCDRILRSIGRIAFPIFCFLLVEGFLHTSNWKKYAGRLFAFALLSEIPYDLSWPGVWWEPAYQNVFFTLGIGVLVMAAFEWAQKQMQWNMQRRMFFCCLSLFVGMAAAQILNTDYAAVGVLCILVLYTTRTNRYWQITAGMISFVWEPFALFAFWPIAHYNGERGISLKYIFYLFYPLHLLLLYLLTYFLI